MASNLGITGFTLHSDKFNGIYRGKVLDNLDPDQLGRIKIQVYPMLSEITDSSLLPWAIPANPLFSGAGSGFGSFVVPEIDTKVWVFFEEGNIYTPVYFAEATDGILGLPSGRTTDYPNTRIFRTKSGIEVNIDGATGKEAVKISHPSGSYFSIDKDGKVYNYGTNSITLSNISGNIYVTPDSTHQAIIRAASNTIKTYVISHVLTPEDGGLVLVSGNTSLTLPNAASYPGLKYIFVKTDVGTTSTIVGTISGSLNRDLTTVYQSVKVVSSGSMWLEENIVAEYSGSVGGWIISPNSLTDVAAVVGMSSLATIADDVRFWAGSTTPTSAPFNVTKSGALTASLGNIAGWVLSTSSLVSGSGTSTVGLDSGGTNPAIYAGSATPSSAPFRVTNAGAVTATSGTIGGWILSSTTLANNAVSNNANVLIDSSNSLIRLGPTTSTYLNVDGANKKISTSDFASGALGSGWSIDNNSAEFQNIRARGIFSTSTFQKTAISSIGGNFLVANSDVLGADMTALDASTLTITGQSSFIVNDILRIKDGTNDEWFQVTNAGSAPTYTVTRDKAGSYPTLNAKPVWKKGTTVVSYGQSNSGLIYMTASDTNAPYIDVITHAGVFPGGGVPLTTTTRMRLGNVNGFLGAVTDLYGIYIGEATKYLKYDSNGLQVAGHTLLGSLSVSTGGYIASGQTAYNTGTGYWMEYNGGTPRFSIGNSAGAYLAWNGTTLICANMQSPDYVAGATGYKLSSSTGLEVNTGTIEGAIVRPTVFGKFGGNGSDGIALITDDDNFSNICERGHLLIHFHGTDGATTYTAESGQTVTFVGTAQLDTAQSQFGVSSLLLNGSTDYVTVPDSSYWNFATAYFTIDFWMKLASTTGYMGILAQTVAAGDDVNNMWELEYNVNTTTDHKMRLVSYSGGVAVCNIISTAAVISDTNWHHVEWVNYGGTVYLLVDGVSKGLTVTTAIGTMPDLTGALRIGTNWNKGNFFNGWLEEVHIQKYVARNIAAFTPPTVVYKSTGGIAQFSAFNLESGKTLTIDTKFMYLGVSGTTCHIHGIISADGQGGIGALANGDASYIGYNGQNGDFTGDTTTSIQQSAIATALGGAGGGAASWDYNGNPTVRYPRGGAGGGSGGAGGSGGIDGGTGSNATSTTAEKLLRLSSGLGDNSTHSTGTFIDYLRYGGGGGGGGNSQYGAAGQGDNGGNGGGVIYIECQELVFDGTLTADGLSPTTSAGAGGGGGGGGVVFVRSKTLTTNSGTTTVTGGTGGTGSAGKTGGNGASGFKDIIVA